MRNLLLAMAFALALGCKSNSQNTGEPERLKAYYREGENDRHNSRTGHSTHF
jgi:hypothetical protein